MAAFRLRTRRRIDVDAAEVALAGSRRRRCAPPCWAWTWPLTLQEAVADIPAELTAFSRLHDIHSAAISDSGAAISFVSKQGTVALARSTDFSATNANPWHNKDVDPSRPMELTSLSVDLSRMRDWDRGEHRSPKHARSLCFFNIADPLTASVLEILAVGYSNGFVAFFDVARASLCAVTRPVLGEPVRRLRFVTSFHALDPIAFSADTSRYPYPTMNSGIFCVFGWSGLVGRLPTTAIYESIAANRYDEKGANWILWRLGAQVAVVDAAPCFSEPSSICEMDFLPSEGPLRVLAAGLNPPIALYSCGNYPAFSAREAARKAATAVFSAAKGVLYSRISSVVPASFSRFTGFDNASGLSAKVSEGETEDDVAKASLLASQFTRSWVDETETSSPFMRFGIRDVSQSARKSVSSVMNRRRLKQSLPESPTEIVSPGRSLKDHHRGLDLLLSPASMSPNSRLVQRCAVAPPPYSLVACCDVLGRILVFDFRDVCVLRVLKGYRDARVSWYMKNEPLLVAFAPRRAVVEIHSCIERRPHVLFKVDPGSFILQSNLYSVHVFTPKGILYELAPSKKTTDNSCHEGRSEPILIENGPKTPREELNGKRTGEVDGMGGTGPENSVRAPPGTELDKFLEFCRTGEASKAASMLDELATKSIKQVAYVMAALVCTSSMVRGEVHVAVASTAARLAANAGDVDLEVRFEAHSRLSEAFGLLAVECRAPGGDLGGNRSAMHSRLASNEILASHLLLFDDDTDIAPTNEGNSGTVSESAKLSRRTKSDVRTGSKDEYVEVYCERFILAHTLLPTIDTSRTDNHEYQIRSREDLSREERIWLARAYFRRLITVERLDLTRGSNPEPSASRDVFLALRDVLGFDFDDIASHFLDFFLWSSVDDLLNTPVDIEKSGLRYALDRLRCNTRRAEIDDMIVQACENTTRISNAMLLVRLCVVHENENNDDVDARYLCLIEQLGQALQLRAHVVGSKAEKGIKGRITARHFQGIPSEAEQQAVSLLANNGEDSRAAGILAGLSFRQPPLEWHELASVSEVALQAARRRMSILLDEDDYKRMSSNVARWIKESESTHMRPELSTIQVPEQSRSTVGSNERKAELKGIQTLLIAAHEHFPDTSIDAVRCLQLAEAINIIAADSTAGEEHDPVSQDTETPACSG